MEQNYENIKTNEFVQKIQDIFRIQNFYVRT